MQALSKRIAARGGVTATENVGARVVSGTTSDVPRGPRNQPKRKNRRK